jgi:hypothetical protein
MSDGLTREEVHEAADRLVEELLASAGVTGPPVDALVLATHLGLEVGAGRPRRGRERPEPSAEQQQWAAAQAIGRHLKAQLRERLGIEAGEGMTGESLANLLAVRVHVPTSWLAEAARASGHDLLELKGRFGTASYEVIAWRLLDLPAPCIISLVHNDAVWRRRSNAWRPGRGLAPAERECQECVSRTGRPHVVNRDGWAVQGWPVPAAGGKREVLRSVVAEGVY